MRFWKLFFNENKKEDKHNSIQNNIKKDTNMQLNFNDVLDNLMNILNIDYDKLDTNTLALPPGIDNLNNNNDDNYQDNEEDKVNNISNDKQEDTEENFDNVNKEGKKDSLEEENNEDINSNNAQIVPSDSSKYEQEIIDDGKKWDDWLKDNSYTKDDTSIKTAHASEGYTKLDNENEIIEEQEVYDSSDINNEQQDKKLKTEQDNNNQNDSPSYEQEVIDDNNYDTNSNISGIELIIMIEILSNIDVSDEQYGYESNSDVEIVDEQELEENNSDNDKSNNQNESLIDKKNPEENKIEENKNAEFLNELKDIPNFEERDRSDGYSFNLENSEEVNNRIIKILIQKFLNQRFKRNDTDLNIRTNSLERKQGFYKWDVKKVIIHKETKQVFNLLNDKYGYNYAEGKNEFIPLSFYFDLSGSMANYSGTLATIAIELLKKKIKVLVGFNEKVNVQIEEIKPKITIEDLTSFLDQAGDYRCDYEDLKEKYRDIKFKIVNRNIDKYLIDAKAEKTVVFTDFDPREEIINLSNYCNLYWFCFEKGFSNSSINGYKGFIYEVGNIDDIKMGLLKVNENRFETLIHLNDVKKKERK